MCAAQKRRFWRICRIYFRRFRIAVWFLVLLILGSIIYLNQVGLPEFVKRPLLDKLKEHGLDIRFSRLRLSWYQGIIAENVHFWPSFAEGTPHLSVEAMHVRLNWKALAQRRLQVDSLMLRQGRISWPFTGSNQSHELSLTHIQTDLRFLPGDQWMLDNFRADFNGARLQVSGTVTNASSVPDWDVFHRVQPASNPARLWQSRINSLADTLERIRFSAPPDLRINIRGDARDLHTFNVLLSVSAPGAQTPWGNVADGHFFARLQSADSNGVSRADLSLESAGAQTPWAAVTNLSMVLRLSQADQQVNIVNAEIKLSAAQVQTPWANGTNATFTATWTHAITNPIPLSGQGNLSCSFIQTSWASASDFQLRCMLLTAAATDPAPDPSLAWWTNLQPYQLGWNCSLSNLASPRLAAEFISCAGDWLAPRLAITNFDATLFDGHLQAHGGIDVATRATRLELLSDVDPHRGAPYLPDSARTWLNRFSWPKPPRLATELACTLPPWTNSHPDWRAEVQPTLLLRGEVDFEQGASYQQQIYVSSAHSHFVYSNLSWRLPDLVLTRPEGLLSAELFSDEVSSAFYSRVSSTIDPMALKPLLEANGQKVFDLFVLSKPPRLEAEIWGRGSDPQYLGARGHLLISNLTFRGDSISRVETAVDYTNRVLRFLKPHIDVADRGAVADALVVDLEPEVIYLTNGVSNVDPMLVARAIGPHIVRAIENYQFATPPNGRVYGTIPLHGEEGADLHFDLAGGPFHWWKFNLPHITGHVHWSGLHLSLTNVQAEFYHGVAAGWAAFDFPKTPGTDFQFVLSATNVLLQSLMADLSSSTNHLEGRLNGDLTVTRANTESWQTVFGYGDAHLKDGLLWDIPLFGIFSPVLNGIVPGMGNSRASAASTTFTITNGFIRTSDLDIRSTGMRLQYRGTVNLDGQLNARVDAELLRDMWLVGPLVSTVFWPVTKLFEYRVSGTLDNPRSEPVFMIPKIMLMPFHPLRTLKGLKPEDPNTNPNFSPLPP
ncbi:MAG TPA: AsmA-like C-terminal region-containing protein [Verrucomicrobiae bacterium]|nr:AsmA-like C-terminal region-containing protein [Verrucomicrobiae bacterium]